MHNKNIPMGITISRINHRHDEEVIRVRIEDIDASIEFVEMDIALDDFAKAITGLACVKGIGIVRGLENVGKSQEIDKFEFKMPDHSFNNQREIARQTVLEICPEGWVPDSGFRSQTSFFDKDGERWARTTIRRWLKKPLEERE